MRFVYLGAGFCLITLLSMDCAGKESVERVLAEISSLSIAIRRRWRYPVWRLP
jgi:hypothetical protein